jgi:hypothetical protein
MARGNENDGDFLPSVSFWKSGVASQWIKSDLSLPVSSRAVLNAGALRISRMTLRAFAQMDGVALSILISA